MFIRFPIIATCCRSISCSISFAVLFGFNEGLSGGCNCTLGLSVICFDRRGSVVSLMLFDSGLTLGSIN